MLQTTSPSHRYAPTFRDLVLIGIASERSGYDVAVLLVEMDLPELSITGTASVIDIQPAPPVKRGVGRVATATFRHTSGDVVDLTIGSGNERETIGTTSNHPFWSVDRQEYVEAGLLQRGETVRTFKGETKTIVSLLARPDPETVCNIEVHGEHVYHVGRDGVLVHNVYKRLGKDRKYYYFRDDGVPISKAKYLHYRKIARAKEDGGVTMGWKIITRNGGTPQSGSYQTGINRGLAAEEDLIRQTGRGTRPYPTKVVEHIQAGGTFKNLPAKLGRYITDDGKKYAAVHWPPRSSSECRQELGSRSGQHLHHDAGFGEEPYGDWASAGYEECRA